MSLSEFFSNEEPVPPQAFFGVGTGVGKSHQAREAIERLCSEMPDGSCIVLAVPTHALGNEHLERLRAMLQDRGLRVAVYRGREAIDPETEGRMCRNYEAANLVSSAGGDPRILCKQGKGATVSKCTHFEGCPYRSQRDIDADVWIVPHSLLVHAPPKFLPAVYALFVDEDPLFEFIGGRKYYVTRDEIREPILIDTKEGELAKHATADLDAVRACLVSMFDEATEDGCVPAAFIPNSVGTEQVTEAIKAIWRTKIEVAPLPNATPEEIRRNYSDAIEQNMFVRRLAGLMKLVRDSLAASNDFIAGVRVRRKSKLRNSGLVDQIEFESHKTVHTGWNAPTAVLTATGNVDLLRYIFPNLENLAEAYPVAPNATIHQCLWSASMQKLKVQSNVERLKHFVEVQAARHRGAGPKVNGRSADVLVVAQKKVIANLRSLGLPDNVDTGWFGAIDGIDKWGNVPCGIIVGRTLPQKKQVDWNAEVLTGELVAANDKDRGGYDKVPLAIQEMASARLVTTEAERHPSAAGENIRWQIAEGGQMQAIGRLRAVRRTEDNPVEIHIISTLPLPVNMDRVHTWEEACPHPYDIMAARGLVLADEANRGKWAIAHKVLEDTYDSPDATRMAFERASLTRTTAIKDSYIASVRVRYFVPAKVRLAGARYAVSVLINPRLGDLRDTAERLLGPLDVFEADTKVASAPASTRKKAPPLRETVVPLAPKTRPKPFAPVLTQQRLASAEAANDNQSYDEILDQVADGGMPVPGDEMEAVMIWLNLKNTKFYCAPDTGFARAS